MSELPSKARVVVIGGGVAGASTLYHLVQKGWKDIVLLEANELTSGSTWHAAGNVPTFSANWEILRMQQYSANLYKNLGEIANYPINYHVTGSIRLAHSDERMEEYRQTASRGSHTSCTFDVYTPAQLKEIYPFLELHDIVGGLWDPRDGDIDPAQLTQALCRSAKDHGAQVIRFCPVTALSQRGDNTWDVTSKLGNIHADIIVNAGGYFAPRVAEMMGRELPSIVMEHQYLITSEIAELQATDKILPLLRDPDDSYYLRQERDALLLGPYEHQGAKARWTDQLPEDFAFQLFPDDLDRIESYIEKAMGRVPLLATAGIQRVVNGPIPYTPDGNPLIGPSPGFDNAFECCVFSFGIAQSGGAGKLLADWIVDGQPEWDIWSCDPRRFSTHSTQKHTLERALEVYHNEYAIGFPNEERPAGRAAKTSPTYLRLQEMGAKFGARNGWERPVYFPQNEQEKNAHPTFKRPAWFSAVKRECDAAQNDAALIDLTGISHFEVTGSGSENYLHYLSSGKIPKVGRIALSYMCAEQGHMVMEPTITRLSDNRFWLMSASGAQAHDYDWLRSHLPKDSSVQLSDITTQIGVLIIVGPKSREVLSKITDAPLDNENFPWMSARRIEIGNTRCWALRVNYVGELGWELHIPMESMLSVYDALYQTTPNLPQFGLYALESMRLEKCYRAFKYEISLDVTPFESSLDRFIDLSKGDFIGKAALLKQKEQGVKKRMVPIVVDTQDADAYLGAEVRINGNVVGFVTSAGYGHRTGKSIALAFIQTEHANEGTKVEVKIWGEFKPAQIVAEPIYDANNSRLKA